MPQLGLKLQAGRYYDQADGGKDKILLFLQNLPQVGEEIEYMNVLQVGGAIGQEILDG